MDKARFDAILSSKPKLHFWWGEWQEGGLTDAMLQTLFDLTCSVTSRHPGIVLETGAGLSTLVFLAAEPSKVITIAPNSALKDRLYAQIAHFSLEAAQLDFFVDRSENVLPDLGKADRPFVDVALIDGGHGMPTVFVDFCYINKVLKQGGYLAIDDMQLYSARQLRLLLAEQPEFELTADLEKLVVFRKIGNVTYLPDWSAQPFVVRNSAARAV